jgi:hypothetical protein
MTFILGRMEYCPVGPAPVVLSYVLGRSILLAWLLKAKSSHLLPLVYFIWHELEWYGLLDYTLIIRLFYFILFMLINL